MGIIIGGASASDLIMDGQSVSLYVGGSPPVKVWPTSEVHEVSLTDVRGSGTAHPLLTVTVPAGETWSVRIQGTVTAAGTNSDIYLPFFRIGTTDSGKYVQGAAVDFSGTVTAANRTIAMVTNDLFGSSFTGTVTIEK